MVGRGAKSRKIEPWVYGLAFNIVAAIIVAVFAYDIFHGGTASDIGTLKRDLDRLEARFERHVSPVRREE